jgi:hypothetical protein
MKIGPMGAELLHADGQTDKHDELNIRFFAILRKSLKTNSKIRNYTELCTKKFIQDIPSKVCETSCILELL